MEKQQQQQCLFNYKLFFDNKRNVKFPAILCLPTFILYTFSIILDYYIQALNPSYQTNSSTIQSANNILISSFLYTLQTVVNMVVYVDDEDGDDDRDNNGIQLKSPKELHNIFLFEAQSIINSKIKNNNKYKIKPSFFALETYITNDISRLKYLQQLFQTNFRINGVSNLVDLLNKLEADGAVPLVEGELSFISTATSKFPPGSLHYTTATTKTYPLPQRMGTKFWGPFYWRIFHTLAKYSQKDDRFRKDSNIAYVINSYPSLLPIIVPCPQCRQHYYINIRPSKLSDNLCQLENSTPSDIYSHIHNSVTENLIPLK